MRFAKLSVLAITLLLACAAWASEVGSISGVVSDPTGAAIVKATVVIRNVSTGVTASVTTNDAGAYSFLALPVGRYDLTVTATGFEKYQETGILLNTNDQLRHDVALKIGSVSNTVEVAADALHVETANTQLGDVISGTQMENIPLNGREYTDLLSLQPGVAPAESTQTASYNQYFGSTETGSISVSGQRETSNGFFVNGANVNDTLNNGTTVVPNLDSIAEFRILTANFDAEYGNYSGGLVTVVTKSGTNALHGDAFDYIRNTGLDARGFFDASVPAFVQNQFGGTLGGPIRRDKLFFFTDYQGTRSNIGQSFGAIPVPTTAERSGDFSALASDLTGAVSGPYFAGVLSSELGYPVTAGEPYYTAGCASPSACVFPNAMIPASAISTPAQALLKYIPAPTSGSTFVSNADTENLRDDLFSGRIDYNSTSFGTISGYYFFDDQTIDIPFGTNNVPGFPTLNGGRSQLFTLSDTKSFGPDALNEVHLNFNRHVYHNGQPLSGLATLSSLGFNENQPGGIISEAGNEEGVPAIDLANFSIGNPVVAYNRYENVPSVSDNFSKVIGRHSIKFGGLYMFDDFIEPIPLAVANGLFIFGNDEETGIDFADFLIGAPTAFVQEAGFDYHNERNYVGLYAQDSWRVRHNFTLNYGLRWDLIQPWYEARNQNATMVPGVSSTVYPGAPEGYVFPGDVVPGYGKIPRGIAKTQYRNFAPRVSIAWSPDTSGPLEKILGPTDKFSVRAGWGMFYQNGEGEQMLDVTGEAPWDVFYAAPVPPLFASPYTNRVDGTQHAPFPFNTSHFDWPLEVPIGGYPVVPIGQLVPYVESYNLTLQRQIGTSTVVSLGYLGNQGHHLLTQIANNPGNPQLCLSLSEPSEVAPGSPTCGPFLENQVYTAANGTVYNSTRGPLGGNFSDDFAFESLANSTYNALQLSVQHTSRHATIFAGYTYSKSLDNTSNIQDKPPNPLNPRLSRGLSSFDNTHNFVISYVLALPFDEWAHNAVPRLTSGWRLSGVTHFATGFPIVLYEEDDHSLEGSSLNADTPDFAGGNLSFQNPRNANINNGVPYFNTSLFSTSAIGSEGTSNRAFFHGPGFNQWDLSLLKDTKITERTSFEFRAEFFNIFNHAQFVNPSGNINGAFGLITEARAGRIGQIVAKFIF